MSDDPAGTVGVSGLPQVEDHAFVVAELARFLRLDDAAHVD